MAVINRVTITEFTFDVPNIGLETAATGVGNMAYVEGAVFKPKRFAIKIDTDEGICGEYVANWIGTPSSMAQAGMLAPLLLGRNPHHREKIWDDMKRELRAYDHMGHGVLDITLWDLCAKLSGTSVKAMLGGWRDTIPTYASSYHAQESKGGMNTPEAFADFAEECQERGFQLGWMLTLLVEPATRSMPSGSKTLTGMRRHPRTAIAACARSSRLRF